MISPPESPLQPCTAVAEPPCADSVRQLVAEAAAAGGAATLAISGPSQARRVVWANAAAAELLGLTDRELLDRAFRPDESIRLDELAHWTVVVTHLLDTAQEDAPHDDTSDRWHPAALDSPDRLLSAVELKLRLVSDDVHVLWLRPMTNAEHLAKDALRESENRFRALAEHAPVGIILSEAGVRLGFVNSCFAELAGVAESGLLGTRWLNTICHEDLPLLLETVEQVLAGVQAEATVRIAKERHAPRWVQIRLSPVVTARRAAGFIGTIEDVTERRAWEAHLTYLAGHDALTGLANRRSLIASLTEVLDGRRSSDHRTAVLFCDLDGFKAINDTMGHETGDRVLVEVGRRLSATARDHDLVARIAGDEFVVMLAEIGSSAEAEAAAVRHLDALAEPISLGDRTVQISASIGIAMAADHPDATSLLRAADRRMYGAKRAGRGQFRAEGRAS